MLSSGPFLVASLLPWALAGLAAAALAACFIARAAAGRRREAFGKPRASTAPLPGSPPGDPRAMIEAISIMVHVLLNNRARSAIREALVFIAKFFGVPRAVLVLFLREGGAKARDNEGLDDSLSRKQRELLEERVSDPVWRAGERKLALPFYGEAEFYVAVAEVKTRGTGIGFIMLARPSSAFSEGERVSLSSIADILAPVFASRFSRSAEEAKRQEAERGLEESERLFQSFVRNSPDMVYRCDREDRFTSINAAGLALLGLASEGDCLGRPYSDFALNESDRAAILKRIKNQGMVRDFEIVIKRPDGRNPFCIESSQPYFDRDGSYAGVHGIVKDISERIENDRRLWQTAMELAEANRSLEKTRDLAVRQEKLASIGQLAAGVAHEINNPLGFIKSNNEMSGVYLARLARAWSELAERHREDAEALSRRLDLPFVMESLERMDLESKDGIDRIVKIVAGLKTFARSDSGSVKAPYDLNAGVQSTLVMAANELKYVADVELELGRIPSVLANGNEINQVLLNVLVNAAQAIGSQGRPGKGKIRVATAKKGEGVVCAISDDGPGMPPEVMARVFEPFFTTKEPGKGTGLGLSISNDIIAAKHGGSMRVESEPGKGTAFTIYLPPNAPKQAENEPKGA